MKEKTLNQLRELAFKTMNYEEQEILKNNPDVGVRRNLALNKFLHKDIANYLLCYDVTVNVSYVASLNRNTTEKRTFNKSDIENKCVSCNKADLFYLNCREC